MVIYYMITIYSKAIVKLFDLVSYFWYSIGSSIVQLTHHMNIINKTVSSVWSALHQTHNNNIISKSVKKILKLTDKIK